MIFVGLDAAHRSVCVLDVSGRLVRDMPLREGRWGLRQLHGLLADLARDAHEVMVGVEQQRGLPLDLVAGADYRLFVVSGSAIDLCRLLRSAVEDSEPSRAAVIAGLVRSLHPGLQPLTVRVSFAGHTRQYRQLAWAHRCEQQRLRGLLARRTGSGDWPENADLDRPQGVQRLVETLATGDLMGADGVGACLARLTDLDLRLYELERRLFEAWTPPGATGGYEGCHGEAAAPSCWPGLGARVGWGRVGVAVTAVMGLSLGLVAPHRNPSTLRAAGALAPSQVGLVSATNGNSTTLLRGAPLTIGTERPGAPTIEQAGVYAAAGGPEEPTAALRPVHVEIPAIDLVTPPLVDLGLDADGGLEVPVDFARAGWYAASAIPGSPGPAVIVGHYDSRRGPAVFYRLSELTPGDVIVVSRSDAVRVTFLVQRVARYPKVRFPTEEVYGPTVQPTLRLITCGGRFDRATGHYKDNLVVFAIQSPN